MAIAPAIAFVPPVLPPTTLARQQREQEVRSGVAKIYDEARRDGLESARAEVAATIAEYEALPATRRDPLVARCSTHDLAARDAVDAS